MDYDAHSVTVDEAIIYPNHTGTRLSALALAVEPNLWPGSFTLTDISIDGTPTTTYSLDGQRLDIALSSFFQPETLLRINIQYSLILPFAEQEDPNVSRPRIFGYTKRQINLTNWYPFVVPYINGEWILHDPWYYGEHLVYDAADYEVNLKFADPASAPIVAASGFPEPQSDSTRYTITSGRAFVITASRDFQVSTVQVGDITVSSYYFALSDVGGRAALKAAAEALQVYGQRYGPYSHKTLSIVMGDFNDGMEYSGLFYLPRDFYGSLYDGTPANYLTFVAVHETPCMRLHINGGLNRLGMTRPCNRGWMRLWQFTASGSITRPCILTLSHGGGSIALTFTTRRVSWTFQFMRVRASAPIPMQFISAALIFLKTCAHVSVMKPSLPLFRIILHRDAARS